MLYKLSLYITVQASATWKPDQSDFQMCNVSMLCANLSFSPRGASSDLWKGFWSSAGLACKAGTGLDWVRLACKAGAGLDWEGACLNLRSSSYWLLVISSSLYICGLPTITCWKKIANLNFWKFGLFRYRYRF